MITTCPHVEPTQQKIAVRCAVDPAVLTETGLVAKLRCDESRWVFPSNVRGSHYFLQSHDIGIDFAQHFNDPIGAYPPVQSARFVDVVGCYSETVRHFGVLCSVPLF